MNIPAISATENSATSTALESRSDFGRTNLGPKSRTKGMPLWAIVLIPLMVFIGLDGISPAGGRIALVALFCGIVLFGVGYSVLRCFAVRDRNADLLLVSPAAGLIAACAASYLATIYGFSLGIVFVGIVVFAIPGLWMASVALRRCWRDTVPYGAAITALVVAIALVYFLPVSLRDGVRTADGGYQWIYVDSSYHQSMVSMVLTGVHPIPDPGFARQGLAYHFGPNALAAVFVNALHISTADAWVRVMRLLGLLSLICGVAAFGVWTAPRRSRTGLTVAFALLLTFFACSAIELFAMHWDSSGHLPAHVSKIGLELGDLFYADVYKDTMFFGSGLWAQVVLFLVAGLLIRRSDDSDSNPRSFGAVVMLAPLGICCNSLAGVSAVGVVAGTFVLFERKSWRNAALILGMVLLCYRMVTAGSFAHGVSSFISGFASPQNLALNMLDLLVWFTLLFSAFKIFAFLSLLDGRKIIFGTLALFSLGWIGFYLLIHLDWNGQAYAMLFLTSLVSGYAAGPAAALWTSLEEKNDKSAVETTSNSLKWLNRFSVVGIMWGSVTLILVGILVRTKFRIGVTLGLLVVLAVIAKSLQFLRNTPQAHWPKKTLLTALGILLVISSLGALRIAWNWGWNGMGTTVALDSGRVRSLLFLNQNSPQAALIATSHHAVPSIPDRPERSYMYSGLSGRRVLLEGWVYREYYFDGFAAVKLDNDALYTTSDEHQAEEIAKKYGISYLITEPLEPLHFDAAASGWLRPISNPGTLGIWKVEIPEVRYGTNLQP